MASDEPVLPPVNSTTRTPGRRRPLASAPSIMASAIRSLYDPVGFTDSSFTSTSAESGNTTRCRRTTGVRPIALRTESAIVMDGSLPRLLRRGLPGFGAEIVILDATPSSSVGRTGASAFASGALKRSQQAHHPNADPDSNSEERVAQETASEESCARRNVETQEAIAHD